LTSATNFKCDELQFGFKEKIGFLNATFAFRTTVDYFQSKGSIVSSASLNIQKACHTVNHAKLFVALSKTGIYKNFLTLLVMVQKLTAVVRRKCSLCPIALLWWVRQCSCLSPSIFNVVMNIFINRLKALRCGYCSL